MKEHKVAELINELTKTAKKFHLHECLRELLKGIVLKYVDVGEPKSKNVYLCYYNLGFGEIQNITIFSDEDDAIDFCKMDDDLSREYREFELE